MGWGFRKSFGAKGFRVTLSKSGISSSYGIKGLRVTSSRRGTHITAGANGFYYRTRVGGRKPNTRANVATGPPPTQPETRGVGAFSEVGTATADQLIPSTAARTLDELNEVSRKANWWWLGLPLTIIVTAVVDPTASVAAFFIGLILTVGWWGIESNSRRYELHYILDPATRALYQRRIAAVRALASSARIERVLSSAPVYDRKYQAGASDIIAKDAVRAGVIQSEVDSNLELLGISCTGLKLLFAPDYIFVQTGKRWGAIAWPSFFCASGATRFIEGGIVPYDAPVVGSTWQYVNRNGGPDARFANNRELPITELTEMRLYSPGGFQLLLHVSNAQAARAFASIFASNTGPPPNQGTNSAPPPPK